MKRFEVCFQYYIGYHCYSDILIITAKNKDKAKMKALEDIGSAGLSNWNNLEIISIEEVK